jgi:multidrug resistance efflux pump
MKRMEKKIFRTYRLGFLRLHHLFPVLVWVAVVLCVVGLFYHRTQRFEVMGIAQGRIHQVAAPCDGQLKIVCVELFDEVTKGQTLAALDDELLKAQMAAICAEIQHLMAQLIPTQEQLVAEAANLETTRAADQRRYFVDVENSELRILELRVLIASDQITLEDLAIEVKELQDLVQQDAIAPYELQRVQAQHDSLAKKIEENQRLLEQAKTDLGQAQQRRDEFVRRQLQHPSVDSALEVIRKEAQVQEKLLEPLLVQRDSLVIRAPADGIVIQIQANANNVALRRPGEGILRRPGEVVLAGDPILTIAEPKPTEVIAYAREDQINLIHEGMAVELVELVQRDGKAQIAPSQITRVGPAIEQLPQQLWRNPNIPQRGRPFLIKIPPQMTLAVGERVGIRML